MSCRPAIILFAVVLFGLPPAALADGYAVRIVEAGESLGGIASLYNIPVDMLVSFNGLEDTVIYPGDVLRVPYVQATGGVVEPAPSPPPGFRRHTLLPGESLSGVIDAYDVSLEAVVGANPDLSSLDQLPAGIELLIPPDEGLVVTLESVTDLPALLGRYGVDPIEVARINRIASPQDLKAGMMLFLPGVAPVEALDRLAMVRELENRYLWPMHGRITSYFGRRNLGMGTASFHRGLDVAAPYGTPVTAARSGTVIYAGWSDQGYGYLVKIRHAGNDQTWYGHHSDVLVSVGEYVRQGEIIGRVGSTGISTGPHLHFELHEGGRPIDPLTLLK